MKMQVSSPESVPDCHIIVSHVIASKAMYWMNNFYSGN